LIYAVRIYGIILFASSFTIISRTKLLKRLEFVKIGAIYLSVTLIRTISAIILAYKGFSYWSIIYGAIIGYIFYVLFFNLAQPSKMRMRFNSNILKKLIGYGKYIFLINIAWFVLSEFSGAAIGKMIGIIAAGYFLIAYKWGFWVFNNIFTFLESILFPVYSKYQKDKDVINKIFYKTLRYSSIVAFPISFGTFLLAPEFTNIILGPKWAPIILPLRILSLAGFIQFLGYLTNPFLKGLGYVAAESKRIYMHLVLLIIFLFPLAHIFGITGACLAILLTSFITQVAFFIYSSRILKIKILEIIKNIYVPSLATFFMGLSIFLARYFVFNLAIKNIWKFTILIIWGTFIYNLVLFLFMRREIISEMAYLRTLYRKDI
jgi:O-antigen/teichoic acid export membrane protein